MDSAQSLGLRRSLMSQVAVKCLSLFSLIIGFYYFSNIEIKYFHYFSNIEIKYFYYFSNIEIKYFYCFSNIEIKYAKQ